MRYLVVALGLLLLATTAEAKPRPRSSSKSKAADVEKSKRSKRVSKRDAAERRTSKNKHSRKAERSTKRTKSTKSTKRVGHATRGHRRFEMPRGPLTGQSLGAPWAGRLREAAELQEGPGYYIRRPWRAFGTRPMVSILERVIADVADRYYDTHEIAIGDLSAESGGRITDHSSHQSGRDVDVGLIFKRKPPAYPLWFVVGTAENLDLEATFVLVEELAKTSTEAGGVQMIFLDFKVQGLLYNWGLENGEDPGYLAKLFQFPHGRGESIGIVRHEPNHADHLHVRFRCPPTDSLCR
jgi:murein endopeptidase